MGWGESDEEVAGGGEREEGGKRWKELSIVDYLGGMECMNVGHI